VPVGYHGFDGGMPEPDRLAPILHAVDRAVDWLDAHHPRDEGQLTFRLLKVSEELGEAGQAWIGATGQNPRKGITHSRTDVADELADVVFAALVAMASLEADPAEVLARKARHLLERYAG
jgi:NTP pyrophosphatase (non-canonical NTP hydrolase)